MVAPPSSTSHRLASGASIDALAEEMIADIREGIGDSGIRPGIIGEIGLGEPMYVAGHTGDEMHRDEEKVLRGAGRAQMPTGLPLTLHIYNYRPNRLAHLALDALEEEGVAPSPHSTKLRQDWSDGD
jgi:phosphotriesterase-related protein